MKIAFGGWNTLTCTINSLASGSARQSNVVDNTSTLADDYEVAVTITPGTITASATTVVNVWVAALMDGTHYSGTVAGGDAAYTLPTYKTQLKLGDIIGMNASTTVEYGKAFSVANLFGGICPDKFVIVIDNETGATLNSSGNVINYQAITYTQGGTA